MVDFKLISYPVIGLIADSAVGGEFHSTLMARPHLMASELLMVGGGGYLDFTTKKK